jgi:hypothetical protein
MILAGAERGLERGASLAEVPRRAEGAQVGAGVLAVNNVRMRTGLRPDSRAAGAPAFPGNVAQHRNRFAVPRFLRTMKVANRPVILRVCGCVLAPI